MSWTTTRNHKTMMKLLLLLLHLLEIFHLQLIVNSLPHLNKGDAKTAAGGRVISPTTIALNLQHQLNQRRSMTPAKEPLRKQEPTLALSPLTKRTTTLINYVAGATSQTIVKTATRLQPRILTMAILHPTQTLRHASATIQTTGQLPATIILRKLLLLLPTTT